MYQNDNRRQAIIEQSIGEKYGMLTVLEFSEYKLTPSNRSVPYVLVRCDCGLETVWLDRIAKFRTKVTV